MAVGFSPVNSRKLPIVIGLLGMAGFTYIAAETDSNFVAVACISAAVFCNGGASGMSWSLASVAAPANCTASLGSMMNFGGYIGGARSRPPSPASSCNAPAASSRLCCSAP